eukprot:984627-Pelagomonas_calceolata.AAC.3
MRRVMEMRKGCSGVHVRAAHFQLSIRAAQVASRCRDSEKRMAKAEKGWDTGCWAAHHAPLTKTRALARARARTHTHTLFSKAMGVLNCTYSTPTEDTMPRDLGRMPGGGLSLSSFSLSIA